MTIFSKNLVDLKFLQLEWSRTVKKVFLIAKLYKYIKNNIIYDYSTNAENKKLLHFSTTSKKQKTNFKTAALSWATSYKFPTPQQSLEKTNNDTLRKHLDRQKDGKTEKSFFPTIIGTFNKSCNS